VTKPERAQDLGLLVGSHIEAPRRRGGQSEHGMGWRGEQEMKNEKNNYFRTPFLIAKTTNGGKR